MAASVTTHINPKHVYGTDEWAEENLLWTRNTLKSAEADCVPVAVNMPHYRAWCARHGINWEEFCSSQLDTEPAWVAKLEEGVAILQKRGHAGPVTRSQAVAASQALAADPEVKPLGPPAPAKGEARNPTGLGGKANKSGVDSITTETNQRTGGNRAEYLVRRLKRDAPTVAAELARGELPSARAAAIKAGIIKVRTKIEEAFRLVERMTPAERLDFDRQIRPLIAAAEASK